METCGIIRSTCEMKFDTHKTIPGCAFDNDSDPVEIAVFNDRWSAFEVLNGYRADIHDYHSRGLVRVTEYALVEYDERGDLGYVCSCAWPKEIRINGKEYAAYDGGCDNRFWVEKEEEESI